MTQDEKPTGYCMKCRSKQDMQNPTQVLLKNGRPALQGKCGECGSKISKLIPMNRGS